MVIDGRMLILATLLGREAIHSNRIPRRINYRIVKVIETYRNKVDLNIHLPLLKYHGIGSDSEAQYIKVDCMADAVAAQSGINPELHPSNTAVAATNNDVLLIQLHF